MLNEIYIAAWKAGLKTTYYLRTLGASQIEKSTLDAKKFGYTQKREYGPLEEPKNNAPISNESIDDTTQMEGSACSLSSDPDCDVCQ
jgi:ribonucleoside-diphosphate reductase alpha chain